jgi:predicted amidohydrolase YtcJ
MRLILAAVCALALAGCNQPVVEAPDQIFHGGTIYTGLDSLPPVEAVSVKGGRIVATGTSADLLKTAGDKTEKVDLAGVFLYPGFTDAHAHLYGIGERERTLDLDEIKSIAELVSVVGEAAKTLPPGQVLIGRGWIETHWPEASFPTRQDLDAVTGDRPTILERADGHAMVANTAALKAAKIDGKPRTQPQGGRIEVDAAGLPTGMLIDNAMGALAVLATAPSETQIDETYEKGAARELSLGWTGVHSMSVPGSHIPRINALSDGGKLNLRIYNAIDDKDFDAKAVFGETADKMVITKAVKLYMDGALGSRGALLSRAVFGSSRYFGPEMAQEEPTLALMKKAYDANIQVCFHAIGDRGNQLVLDWMQKTFDAAPDKATADKRWRIEHAQILRLEDIVRFHADRRDPVDAAEPCDRRSVLSRLRASGRGACWAAMRGESLIDAGAIIAGGSDAPVEQGDPRIEFYAAVARKDLQGKVGPDWHPEQAVTREEALKMFTIWPAYASFREADLGTIEVGKIADFTGFSGDIMTYLTIRS